MCDLYLNQGSETKIACGGEGVCGGEGDCGRHQVEGGKESLQDVRCFYSNTKKKEERWESKQDEKAACILTDVDEEERSAQISSAHS